VAAIAIVAAACLTGTAARATDLSNGALNIKGSLYINGVEYKVKCSSSDGNVLDSSATGDRFFHLTAGNACYIYGLTGPSDTFAFYGQETFVNAKQSWAFSGAQDTSTSAPSGSAAGLLKCAGGSCTKDQGTMDLSYDDGFGDVYVFIGKYKASFH
jgi:hypothetical protein